MPEEYKSEDDFSGKLTLRLPKTGKVVKLKTKLILFTVFTSIISIASISAINYFVSIGQLKEDVDAKFTSEVMALAQEADSWMAMQKDSIHEIIESLVVVDNFEYDFVYNFLKEAGERNPGNEYYIAFSDKTFISGVGWIPDSSYDPTSREWYKKAIEYGDFYISSPDVDYRTGDMVITISKPFTSKDGRRGVINSDIKMDYMVDLIEGTEMLENSYIFLMDQEDNIIAHINEEFMPKEEGFTKVSDILGGRLEGLIANGEGDLMDKRLYYQL